MKNTAETIRETVGGFFVGALIVGAIALGLTACGKSDAEKHAVAQAKAAKAQADVIQKAEDKRKGFHCLSGWNGAYRPLESWVKEKLRDPDSYDHIETRITPVNEKGEHVLVMKYRAKNGFGGMNVERYVITVKNESCGFGTFLELPTL